MHNINDGLIFSLSLVRKIIFFLWLMSNFRNQNYFLTFEMKFNCKESINFITLNVYCGNFL